MATMTKSTTGAAMRIAIAVINLREHDNWVGALQNAAIAGGAPTPSYRIEPAAGGTAHEPIFQAICNLLDNPAAGRGMSKQAAKRAAAEAWCLKYRE